MPPPIQQVRPEALCLRVVRPCVRAFVRTHVHALAEAFLPSSTSSSVCDYVVEQFFASYFTRSDVLGCIVDDTYRK